MTKVLFKVNGSIVFTRNYTSDRKTVKAGTSGIITDVFKGFLGGITNITVRLSNGDFVREVPIDYFRAS
jgi:hypothetical protein